MFAFLPVLLLLLMPSAWTSVDVTAPDRSLAWHAWLHDRNVPVAQRAAVIAIAIRAARPVATQPPVVSRTPARTPRRFEPLLLVASAQWPGRQDRAGPA
ncbi:MAG: hypothetical protein SFX74_09705 [Fimbriimonadaceae bacterium]|nr:hypothetical protein [Fimbriimonadaceae bacterium]